ncbi:hypothetical protein L0Z72_12200 [candidate division KSB1 bacterium]|nr:hypothetical protein [candidate division KSB1 bacterium]
MNFQYRLKTTLNIVTRLFRYNLKIIFANKFIYFLLAATIIFLLVTGIILLDSDANPTEGTVYYVLLFPGTLLIFYPTVFGIQNDVDTQMVEILFGIPNYRYKVWLVRIVLIYIVVSGILLILNLVASAALVSVPLFKMTYQLMFPIFFLGSLAFMVSTMVRNGNGTAVIIIIIGLAFWIASEPLAASSWNLFLNPFSVPSNVNEAVWADTTFNNRLYLFIGTVVAVLFGLLFLQKREKFI